jgi:hypothetical protein
MNDMNVEQAKAWLRQRKFAEWGEWLIRLLEPGEEAEWLNAVNGLRRSIG